MTAYPRVVTRVPELNAYLQPHAADTGVLLIGVCGPAGAGKTTLCNEILATQRLNAFRLDCDQFSTHSLAQRQARIADARASGLPNRIAAAENPQHWYAFDDIRTALGDLKSHRTHSCLKAWNRETGERDALYCVTLPEGGLSVVLCDGIYLLHDPVSTMFDLTVLVDTPAGVLRARGLARSKGDTARAAFMERLHETYAAPDFRDLAERADVVFRPARLSPS